MSVAITVAVGGRDCHWLESALKPVARRESKTLGTKTNHELPALHCLESSGIIGILGTNHALAAIVLTAEHVDAILDAVGQGFEVIACLAQPLASMCCPAEFRLHSSLA